jgi:hypothetical protein
MFKHDLLGSEVLGDSASTSIIGVSVNYVVCLALLAPASVLLALIVVVAVRPSTSTALAEVLRAAAEPLGAISWWRRGEKNHADKEADADISSDHADG